LLQKILRSRINFSAINLGSKSNLMAAYAYYIKDYYSDAISELERFLKTYPKHHNIDYAYYLMAMCYYEQIVDEKRDLDPLVNAKEYFKFI
jgi:outer membrane protein assembly factor BamD